MHAHWGQVPLTGGRCMSRKHESAHTKHVRSLGKARISFQLCSTADLTVLSLADRADPTGIHFYTLSWLHLTFPSPLLSLTLEHRTGAKETGRSTEGKFNGRGSFWRYFVVSTCLKLWSQVLLGAPFKMTADCVADSWLRAIKTDAWTMTTYTSPLCSVPAIFSSA